MKNRASVASSGGGRARLVAASASAPAQNESSRSERMNGMRSCGSSSHPGTSIVATNRKNVTATAAADQPARIPVTMLNAAAMKQTPMKYAQNPRHGSHDGTSDTIASVNVKCSTPNAASGAA